MVEDLNAEEVLTALERNGWRRDATARELQISRTSLYKIIANSDEIPKASELTPEQVEACAAEHDGDVQRMAAALRVSPHGLKVRLQQLA